MGLPQQQIDALQAFFKVLGSFVKQLSKHSHPFRAVRLGLQQKAVMRIPGARLHIF